jgi:transcriptional regulator with XRE-family HTH domain
MKTVELFRNRINIGCRIAGIRKVRNLSQTELAIQTGMTQSNISRIESGKYSTTLDVIFRIAQVLDCEIAFILR